MDCRRLELGVLVAVEVNKICFVNYPLYAFIVTFRGAIVGVQAEKDVMCILPVVNKGNYVLDKAFLGVWVQVVL